MCTKRRHDCRDGWPTHVRLDNEVSRPDRIRQEFHVETDRVAEALFKELDSEHAG
jgi:hypothetical protein